MRPLYVLTALGVNRWAHYAPTGISATGWRIAAVHPRDFTRAVTIAKGGSLIEGNLSSLEIEAIALEELLNIYTNRGNMYSKSINSDNIKNNSEDFNNALFPSSTGEVCCRFVVSVSVGCVRK